MNSFVFVGERPSLRAAVSGATWQNGRLSAKNLRDALVACGLDPALQRYHNLWAVPGLSSKLGPVNEHDEQSEALAALTILRDMREGFAVVGMGALVCRALKRRGIAHRCLVHPAARGAIRKTERYQAHVRSVLLLEQEVRG